MANWKSLRIPQSNIKIVTDKAVLIQMPNGSDYEGYTFWHPAKLFNMTNEVIYTDGFVFRLQKKCRNRFDNSWIIVDKKEVDASEILDAFSCKNASDRKQLAPEVLKPIENPEPLEELRDD